MRMTNPLVRRLSALEAALMPAGRVFFVWDAYDGAIEEKVVAFRSHQQEMTRVKMQ